jgi:hypothetical protein
LELSGQYPAQIARTAGQEYAHGLLHLSRGPKDAIPRIPGRRESQGTRTGSPARCRCGPLNLQLGVQVLHGVATVAAWNVFPPIRGTA